MWVDEIRQIRLEAIKSRMTQKEQIALAAIREKIVAKAEQGEGDLQVTDEELPNSVCNILWSEGFRIDYWQPTLPRIIWEWDDVLR